MAAILGNLPLPFLNANLSAIMRNNVPLSMQGRVFAARDTVQYCTIPIGIALGDLLTDRIFEPLMQDGTRFTAFLVGRGAGSGAAMLFLLTGITGVILSLLALKQPAYCILEEADKT